VASDELTGQEAAAILSKTIGRAIKCAPMSSKELEQAIGEERGRDMTMMFDYYSRVGMHADIEQLRFDYPEVGWHRFADWVQNLDWEKLLANVKQW